MISWPNSTLSCVSISEKHAIVSYFLSRFSSRFVVGSCENCGFGSIIKKFTFDEAGGTPFKKCSNHLEKNVRHADTSAIVDQFKKFDNLDQVEIVIKFMKCYRTKYNIVYCSECAIISVVHVSVLFAKDPDWCADIRCDSIFCEKCVRKRSSHNLYCFKHNTLFEALYGYIIKQKRINI